MTKITIKKTVAATVALVLGAILAIMIIKYAIIKENSVEDIESLCIKRVSLKNTDAKSIDTNKLAEDIRLLLADITQGKQTAHIYGCGTTCVDRDCNIYIDIGISDSGHRKCEIITVHFPKTSDNGYIISRRASYATSCKSIIKKITERPRGNNVT